LYLIFNFKTTKETKETQKNKKTFVFLLCLCGSIQRDMKKFLLTASLFCFLFTTIHSQKPFYHKNKTISWVGETEFTYYLENYDRLNFSPPRSEQEETRTIKLDPYATCEFGNEKYFTNFIINEALEGRRKVFSLDGDFMTQQEVELEFGTVSIDTTTILDPVTKEESLIITQTDPKYQVQAFKVRQWWFYDKEKESLGSLVRAIAPIIETEKSDGTQIRKTLFWIEMEQDYNKDYDFNDPFVIWAKETVTSLSFKDIKKKKGRTKKTLKNLTYKNPKKGKIKVLENDSWYPYCADPINKEEVSERLEGSVDTVITFDPVTYKEEILVAKKKKVDYKDFDLHRVLQHWYFDKSTNTLASKVITIGPMENVYDDKGELKFRRALYYIPSAQ